MIQSIQGSMAAQALQGNTLQGIQGQRQAGGSGQLGGVDMGDRFTDALSRAVSATDARIQAGNNASEALAAGEDVGLHETVIAVEKADIALRTFVSVKNRVVEAYQEIMRMQI